MRNISIPIMSRKRCMYKCRSQSFISGKGRNSVHYSVFLLGNASAVKKIDKNKVINILT